VLDALLLVGPEGEGDPKITSSKRGSDISGKPSAGTERGSASPQAA
jgi:hypothetical protein